MKANTIIIMAALAALSACGPSKEEIAIRENFKTDSISNVAREALLKQQAAAEEERMVQEQREYLKQQLIELKAQLAGAEQKLDSIGDFQLFRTQDEKAQQVEAQTRAVEEIKSQITDIEAQLN